MPGPRRRLAALITSGVTLALTAGFGSPLSVERLSAHGNSLLAELLEGLWYPRWSLRPVNSTPHSTLTWITPEVADVVLAIMTGLVAAVIVANKTRIPALLAGWGMAMVLAAAVGAGRVFVIGAINHSGSAVYAQAGTAITTGLWFGLATGWLTGLIVACAVRKKVTVPDPTFIEDREVSGVRIWTPSQPDWQKTQDIPAATFGQPGGAQPTVAQPAGVQPTVTQPAAAQPTVVQPATAPPSAAQLSAQPAAGQPWPPATAP
jgi:hypothetical protein